jgi:hypothetical protein
MSLDDRPILFTPVVRYVCRMYDKSTWKSEVVVGNSTSLDLLETAVIKAEKALLTFNKKIIISGKPEIWLDRINFVIRAAVYGTVGDED